MSGYEVKWAPAEWDDEAVSAELRGYEASVVKEDASTGWDGKPYPAGYGWVVKATAAVSEWPEVQATGFNRSLSGATRSAGAALKRAAKSNHKWS